MIIAAICATLVISMGGTIWYLNTKLDNTKSKLLIEQVNTATLVENLKHTEKEIIRVNNLLRSTNSNMINIRNERDEAKQVLQDSSRLAILAKKRNTLISKLAVNATAKLWTEFEYISKSPN